MHAKPHSQIYYTRCNLLSTLETRTKDVFGHVNLTLEGSGSSIITNTFNYTSLHCLARCQVHRRAATIPPTIHQQQTANMLAHSVAAGAQAASVSSRKPLAVRAQAVSEVAVANGSSTSTAPPPRAKASCRLRAARQQLNCCLPSASLRLSDAALLHVCESPAPAQIARHTACLCCKADPTQTKTCTVAPTDRQHN